MVLHLRNARSTPSPSHVAQVDEEPPVGATEQLGLPSPGTLPLLELLLELVVSNSVQTPAVHMPAEHQEPSGLTGFEHPMTGSQSPTSWHWSLAVHATAVPPVHAPF